VGANNPLAGQSGLALAVSAHVIAHWLQRGGKVGPKLSAKFGGLDGIGYGLSATATTARSPIAPLTVTSNWTVSTRSSRPTAAPTPVSHYRRTIPVLPSARCLLWRFPCPESEIWTGGLSFPNLRNGTYSAWTVLRLVTNAKGKVAANDLIKKSQAYVVSSVPDYVPFVKTTVAPYPTDPGLTHLRSHYQQYDGGGNLIGAAPHNAGTTEAGGDLGAASSRKPGRFKNRASVNNNPSACVTRP